MQYGAEKSHETARAVDVAEFILQLSHGMDAMKLQKLCYYVQAWSLAWGRGIAFGDPIEAWKDGPVIRNLFARHKGQYFVTTVSGDATRVLNDPTLRATVTDVYNYYAAFTGQQLRDLAHIEQPWATTRALAGVTQGQHSESEIPLLLMETYYRSLMQRELSVEQTQEQNLQYS